MRKFYVGLVLAAIMVPVFAGITYEAHGGWAIVWGGWTMVLVGIVFSLGVWWHEDTTEEFHQRAMEREREATRVLSEKRRAERGY